MLKMLLQGVPVNYPPDISLNLIYENPFFFNDRIPSNHSLNFVLPATNHNLKLFNRPDRMNSFDSFQEYDGFEIYFGSIRILSGVLVVQEFERDIKCFFRGSVITDDFRLPSNEFPMELYSFGDSASSTFFFDPDYWGYHYRVLMLNSITHSENFYVPPMRIADQPWPFLSDQNAIPTSGGDAASANRYVNYFNAKIEMYMMRQTFDRHTVCYPFPRLKYLFEVIFGGKLNVNPFDSEGLDRLAFTSVYHPRGFQGLISNSTRRGMLLDGYNPGFEDDNFFRLNSFLSSLPANELIKESLKLICASLFPIGNNFVIRSNADILSDTDVLNWTAKRINTLRSYMEPGQFYAFGYSATSEKIEDYIGTSVVNIEDLYTYPMGEEEEVELYVQATDEMWKKRLRPKAEPSDPQRYIFELQKTNMGTSAGSGFDMKVNLEPVRMGIEEFWYENSNQDGINFGDWYVPVFSGDRLIRPERPQIGIFHGMQDSFSTLPTSTLSEPNIYPLFSPYDVDAFGNPLGNLSLKWDGENGLMAKFHAAYRDYIQADKKAITAYFLFNGLDLKNMDLSKKVHLNGINFLIKRINITIRQKKIDPAQVDLVQADL